MDMSPLNPGVIHNNKQDLSNCHYDKEEYPLPDILMEVAAPLLLFGHVKCIGIDICTITIFVNFHFGL